MASRRGKVPFILSGGTLTGPGVLTLTGTGNQWTAGTISGAGTTQFNGDLAISGAASKGISGNRVINTAGTTCGAQKFEPLAIDR